MGKVTDLFEGVGSVVDDIAGYFSGNVAQKYMPREGETMTRKQADSAQRGVEMQLGAEKLATTRGKRQRLTQEEYDVLNDKAFADPDNQPRGQRLNLSAAERRDVTGRMIDYRNKFTVEGGFQPFKLRAYRKANGDVDYTIMRKGQETGFNYHKNPDTGKQLEGAERQGGVNSLATRMVQNIRKSMRGGSNDAESVMQARRWYGDVRDHLRETYGAHAQKYSQFQAGGSPNNALANNFELSDGFFKRYMNGGFDDLLKDVDEYIAGGGTINELPERLLPRKADGTTKYGMAGRNMLNVIYGDFQAIKAGQAPKMRNYDLNLIGESDDATIDLWAARHLQGLSGRLQPPPEWAVVQGSWQGSGRDASGKWLGKRPPRVLQEGPAGDRQWVKSQTLAGEGYPMRVGGEYGYGKDVYEEAARMMRESDPQMWGDLTARDLQAMGWLDTQNKWKHEGWGAPQEDANLIELMRSGDSPDTVSAGISGARDRFDPSEIDDAGMMTGETYNPNPVNTHARMIDEFTDDLPSAVANPTEGVFAQTDEAGNLGIYPENAIDYTAMSYGDPTEMKNTVLERVMKATSDANQNAGFVSHEVPAGAEGSLAGLEVFSKYGSADALDKVIPILNKYDIHGSTFSTNAKGERTGLRSQFAPAFSKPEKVREWMDDPIAYDIARKDQRLAYESASKEIGELEGIDTARQTFHDTRFVNSIDDPEGSFWSNGRSRMPWKSAEDMWKETPEESLKRMYDERMGRPDRFWWEDAVSHKTDFPPIIFRGR